MPALFTLTLTLPSPNHAVLRLADERGYVAAFDLDPTSFTPAEKAALFDTRRHIESQTPTPPAQTQLSDLGHFISQRLLGPAITGALGKGIDQRTLLIHLPDPSANPLAADLARVPWEMAITAATNQTLLERNVSVRIVPGGIEPARETALTRAPGELVRVLLVFAETPGARPLAARLERERLLHLFHSDILPRSKVEVDVLAHGVTLTRLEEQIRRRAGYHLVHWSGHGRSDTLELGSDDGERTVQITGSQLARLFETAGGFLPGLMFLSACHSGALGSTARPGSTGAAIALLAAGVTQVVAMRYEVGDHYARRLARRFYRGLLAEEGHHAVDKALSLARRELLDDQRRAADYHPVDHATPLVFGSKALSIRPEAQPSAQMNRWRPKHELLSPDSGHDLDKPAAFTGREGTLAQLARVWLAPTKAGTRSPPIALLRGPAGIGKTTLAAEALHAWFGRFDVVIAFPARGKPLSLEQTLRRIHQVLHKERPSYRRRCEDNEQVAVYLPPDPAIDGAERQAAMRDNLIAALGAERVLLVLDGFEASLLSAEQREGHAAQDPAWDALLSALADRLGETGSRLLVTSRRAPAALARSPRTQTIALGLLSTPESAAFFEADPFLRALCAGGSHAAHGKRLRKASLGHPWILARIAELARKGRSQPGPLSPAATVALEDTLARLEVDGYRALPALFPERVGVGAPPRVSAEAVAAGLAELQREDLSAPRSPSPT